MTPRETVSRLKDVDAGDRRCGTARAGAANGGVRQAEIEAVLPMPSADVMLSLLAQMEG